MMDCVAIQLALIDTYSSDPSRSSGISVQLICGPSSQTDFRPIDLGLDSHMVTDLAQKSRTDTAVREVGEYLLAALRRSNAVRNALDSAQSHPICPISLIFAGQNGITLPWETLFDSSYAFDLSCSGFLEFTGITPTSRAVPAYQDSATTPAVFDRPRMLAILSAPREGEQSAPGTPDDWSRTEFQQLTDAIAAAGIDVDLQVLTSEQAVLATAMAGGVSATQISDEVSVINKIRIFDPHFLHFFCHGFDTPSPHLALYGPADVYTSTPTVRIDASLLTRHIGCTCLVVLNSCSGATSEVGTESMAQTLVSKRFPAAIGMREPVEWHDATSFTFAFYRHVLDTLRSRSEDRIDLRLLVALESARRAILSRFNAPIPTAAEQHREWTIPVVYTRPDDLLLPIINAGRGDSPEQLALREGGHLAIRSVRNKLHPETPQEAADSMTVIADQLTMPATSGADMPDAGDTTADTKTNVMDASQASDEPPEEVRDPSGDIQAELDAKMGFYKDVLGQYEGSHDEETTEQAKGAQMEAGA